MNGTTAATAVARAYFEAWNAHDADAIVGVFSEDGTFWDNQMEQPQTIREAKAGFEAFLRAVPDLTFVVHALAETVDGSVVAEWRMTGTRPGGNGQFSAPGIDVFDIADGRIRAARAYLNPSI